MKNENFKKRLALALVPILSLTSVIGNVPILPTSVFAVTQDEVYIEEPAVIEEETLEVEEPAVIVEETLEVEEPAVIEEETEEVEEPEALLNEVPEDLQNLSVVNKDVLNAGPACTITGAVGDSKVAYKFGADGTFKDVTSGDLDFADIGADDVIIKIGVDATQTLKTFTYTTPGETVDLVVESNGEVVIPNPKALNIIAIDVEFEDKTTYAISWTDPADGTLTVTLDEEEKASPYVYTCDDENEPVPLLVKLTPASGKQVATFKVGGEDKKSMLSSGEFSFVPEKDTDIVATFEDIPTTYAISWTVGTGGTLKVGNATTSPYTSDGTEITVTITPATGKQVATFTVGKDSQKAELKDNVYKFTPSADTAIAVTFEDIPTTYAISWTDVTGGTLKVGDATTSPYAYVKDAAPPVVEFTADAGKVLTEFKVGGVNKLSKVVGGKYTFEAKPTKAVAITAKFETTVCKIGSVEFASLASAIAYINAQTSATDYTIDILNNIPSLALTLPAATKAKSITLKSAKTGGDPVVDVAISNPTLAIPTALILDNVVLKASAVNLTLSATASALTVKAGGGIENVSNVTTAADKVITLEDTTKFEIKGNLSGKPNITINDDLVIAGTVAIGELTYAADAKVTLKKEAAAASTINKIVVDGDFVATLQSSKLSLTIVEIDAVKATSANKGLSIQAIELGSKKYPVFKITGTVTKGKEPIALTLYKDNKYDTAATIDPTTAIITSVKTTKPAAASDTTGAMFKTLNKNGEASYSFYKDGTSLKLGNTFVEVLDGDASKENFIRLQDALDYINTNKATLAKTVIKVSGDIPSHGILTFPEEDITIQSKEPVDQEEQEQYKVLFTGSVKLNANLTLKNIELSNGNIKGIAFDLNNKNLILDTGSKVIFNTIKDTKLPEGTKPKPSKLTVTDSGDLTFLGAITSIGTVDIDDNTIFKGAVSNVAEIDIAAGKYAYFRGGAITNTLKYGTGSIINLPVNAKGGVTKNITIKDTTTGAITCTGTGKLEVNAVKDKLDVAVAATSTTPAVPEKITIETAAGASEKVNPGAVIVKLVKDSKVLASSFVTDAKNFKLTTDQTLIATKAGTAIKIAAPKLTATAPEITDTTEAFSENFVTIEEALAVVALDAAVRDYKLAITDNIVGADLTNIPAKVTVITAAKPAEGKLPFKIVTAKDIGLNGGLIIENLNILAAAKTIGTVITTGTGDTAKTTYKNAHNELVLVNASLTVSEAYLDCLTLTGLDENDKLVGSSNVTFKKTGYIGDLMLGSGTTAGKIGSIPEESKRPE